MPRLRLLLPLLLALPLGGCYADQHKQLQSCEADAAHKFTSAVPGQPMKFIQSCMADAGYRFIGWNDGVICDMAAVIRGKPSATGTDTVCFEPSAWLSRKIYRTFEVPEKDQTAAPS